MRYNDTDGVYALDLIMCRRQPGIGMSPSPVFSTSSSPRVPSHRPFVREVRREVVRLSAPPHSKSCADGRRHAALSVIPTYAPRPLSASVTNATLSLTEDDASSAALLVSGSLFVRLPFSAHPQPAGISDAYYCAECTRLEKDRDGCPKIVNLGASRTDLFYERRRLGV